MRDLDHAAGARAWPCSGKHAIADSTEMPEPDPAPPPIENPGDTPLLPITDPDVVDPGEPSPAYAPMRVGREL